MRRDGQRGIGFFSVLFWIVFAGAIYVGASYWPVLSDDYTLKRVARGACNDFLARNVTSAEGIEDMFRRGIGLERLTHLKPVFRAKLDEASWQYAELSVTYTRSWKLLWTKKQYMKTMKWTMRQER